MKNFIFKGCLFWTLLPFFWWGINGGNPLELLEAIIVGFLNGMEIGVGEYGMNILVVIAIFIALFFIFNENPFERMPDRIKPKRITKVNFGVSPLGVVNMNHHPGFGNVGTNEGYVVELFDNLGQINDDGSGDELTTILSAQDLLFRNNRQIFCNFGYEEVRQAAEECGYKIPHSYEMDRAYPKPNISLDEIMGYFS